MIDLNVGKEIYIKRIWIQNRKCNVARTGNAADILKEYLGNIPATVYSVGWDYYNDDSQPRASIKVTAIVHSGITNRLILLTDIPAGYIYEKIEDKDAIDPLHQYQTFDHFETIDFKDFYTPLRIIYNNPATIVFWRDGTKTVVKKNEKERYNSYNAFCAALAKKIYGTNSEVNRIVRSGYNQKVAEGQKKLADAKKKADQKKIEDFKKKIEAARKAKKKGEKK